MEDKPVNLAVLFADISGSSRLYEELGNALAADCVALLLGIMRGAVLGCGGRVVQTVGDEILCVFPSASAAVQASVEMQSRVEIQEPVAGQRLQIHVGLQFGPVLEKGPDISATVSPREW
jgi:class 3 adenylate cyclase